MTEISFFQRYSQRENHITNNTLLMFRHLYQHNAARFEKFLHSITDDDSLKIGPIFTQQERRDQSVPDGLISQHPFNLYIEAKLDGTLDKDQILRHLEGIKNNDQSYVIGLTKERLSGSTLSSYQQLCNGKGVIFSGITYTQILNTLKEQAKEYETDLMEIIDDYEQFLISENMITNPFLLISFPCRNSANENIAYRIYYEPAHRPSKENVPYLGIYNNKQITHIGKIKKTTIATLENGVLRHMEEKKLSTDEEKRISQIIEASTYYPDLAQEPHRYYVIDELQEVNLCKTTPYGIQGKKYFDLKEFSDDLKENMSLAEIARLIHGKSFE